MVPVLQLRIGPRLQVTEAPKLGGVPEALHQRIAQAWSGIRRHGDYKRWQACLAALPQRMPSHIELNADAVSIGRPDDIGMQDRQGIEDALRGLHPWRKGPFDVFGIHIDTEWRSDLKWNRLQHAIAPLAGRCVLDVGCGSGYHLWRMRGAGASFVAGIDPTPLYAMQFTAIQHFIRDENVQHWPIGIDDMPQDSPAFDTVFSMGVLYHRRSPIDHLLQLKELLRPGGELVLETLVVDGDVQSCLLPQDRYAKMRNVWFIPSVAMLETWLQRAGFCRIRLVHASPTTVEEQRRTDWMRFESLRDFLDPADFRRTIEGYPAPVRAIMLAENPA
jgi:tRNA (mo5U34)-methyltransferase